MSNLKISLFGILLLMLTLPTAVNAQGTTYELAFGIPHEINIAPSDEILVNAYPDKSYCCSILDATSEGNGTTFGSIIGSSSFLSTNSSRGLDAPEIGATSGSIKNNGRICWHEGSSTAVGRSILRTAGDTGLVKALCEETTLVGGFNTSVTDFNFLEISVYNSSLNTFDTTVTGIIYVQRTINGNTEEIPFSITVPAGQNVIRQDFSIHDAVSNVADFGAVSIIHNGSAAQVKAKLTQYRIVSQSPLDFEPVLQEIFTQK